MDKHSPVHLVHFQLQQPSNIHQKDEKNILINRGAKKNESGIRGSDGRMAYLEDLETAIKIVADWAGAKGTMAELFMAFWTKNEEMGYGHQE